MRLKMSMFEFFSLIAFVLPWFIPILIFFFFEKDRKLKAIGLLVFAGHVPFVLFWGFFMLWGVRNDTQFFALVSPPIIIYTLFLVDLFTNKVHYVKANTRKVAIIAGTILLLALAAVPASQLYWKMEEANAKKEINERLTEANAQIRSKFQKQFPGLTIIKTGDATSVFTLNSNLSYNDFRHLANVTFKDNKGCSKTITYTEDGSVMILKFIQSLNGEYYVKANKKELDAIFHSIKCEK